MINRIIARKILNKSSGQGVLSSGVYNTFFISCHKVLLCLTLYLSSLI
jgi:hypothetical protein